MNPVLWRNLSIFLFSSGTIMFLVTLILSFKYNYLYLLKFYFQQKKINKNPDNIYIPQTTLNLSDLSTTENNKKGSTQKPVYAEKQTATIRIPPRTEVAHNKTDATVLVKINNLQDTDATNKTEELNATIPISNNIAATVPINHNKNNGVSATVPVNNKVSAYSSKDRTIDLKKDTPATDENIAENTPDNSEFKPVENIIVINSDIETISKIGSFI
ncbi:MAG: hypothetical protein E7510_04335 [Ruminococcus sp.]|nr:hypothetical protein [Ruminococcus sp.]